MPTPTGYRTYKSDESKAKTYDHRVFTADQDFAKYKGMAEGWYSRYENAPRVKQVTAKGHRTNVPTGVAVMDALFSAMTAVDIDVHATATHGAPRMLGELASAALSQEWDLLNGQQAAAAAVKDALIVGIGWVKVGYEWETDVSKQPRDIEAIRADIAALLKQARDAQAAGVPAKDLPDPEQISQLVDVEEDVETVLRDRIVIDYVPWDMVRVDPTAKRIEDVSWVASKTRTRLDDIKGNGTYREYCKKTKGGLTRLDDVKGSSTIASDLLPDGGATDDDQFVDVIEMSDLRTGTVCTYIQGKKWLLNESVNPFAANLDYKDRNPYVPLIVRKTNTRLRGISDMELIAPSLDEQDVYRSNTATFIERFVPKVMGPEDALTDEGKEALQNSQYGAYVSIAREYQGESITPLNPPALPSEVWNMEQRIQDSIYDATGANELMRGLFPDRKRTATETAEVVSASSARQSEKRNTLEQFYIDIIQRVLQLMQTFYDSPRMVKYVDPSYGEVPWEFTGEDVTNHFKLKVHLTPMEAVTAASKRDDALAYINMALAFPPNQDGSTLFDMAKLAEWFSLEFGLTRTEVLDILNTPEEQQAQQMAAQQTAVAAGAAEQGQLSPGLTSGPLDADQVSALTNQGALPPEVGAAAVGGIGPGVAQAVEQVSESAGARSV